LCIIKLDSHILPNGVIQGVTEGISEQIWGELTPLKHYCVQKLVRKLEIIGSVCHELACRRLDAVWSNSIWCKGVATGFTLQIVA